MIRLIIKWDDWLADWDIAYLQLQAAARAAEAGRPKDGSDDDDDTPNLPPLPRKHMELSKRNFIKMHDGSLLNVECLGEMFSLRLKLT